MHKRDSYIDNIAGLLIIYMIFVHILQWSRMQEHLSSYWLHPLSFFMFWFFYKSGMFYKEKSCKETLLGGGKKLMIPYIVFSLMGHLLYCVKMFMEGDTSWIHYVLSPIKQILLSGSLGGNLPLWFLPSLLAVQIIYTVLQRNLNDGWITIIGLSIACLLYYFNIHKPLYVGNIALGLAAFGFGHLMKMIQYEKVIFALAGIAYMTILLTVQGTIDFRINMPHNGNYLIVVLFALSGCVVINNIFKRISFSLKLFEWIGKRSMNFYVMHWLVLLTCSIVFPCTGWTMFGVMTVACMMTLPVLDRMMMTP